MNLYRGIKQFGILVLLGSLSAIVLTQTISDEAQRRFVRGQAAAETNNYQQAELEFDETVKWAPNWAEAWFNLGIIQEKVGKLKEATASLNRFLQLAPKDPDVEKVKKLIYKLEYKVEQEQAKAAKYSIVLGVWCEQLNEFGYNGEWTVTQKGAELFLDNAFKGSFDGTTLTFYQEPGILPAGIYKELKVITPNLLRGRYHATDSSEGGLRDWYSIEWTRVKAAE